MYGTQTEKDTLILVPQFENDVKMYGTQTNRVLCVIPVSFENDVKCMVLKLISMLEDSKSSLRMM